MRRTSVRRVTYTFVPQFSSVATFSPVATPQEFAREKSMYSATVDFVQKQGGSLSKMLLTKIPQQYYDSAKFLGLYPNIDIRVHQFNESFLKTPGLSLYPAIPGWHCDGEWRETYFSQPDLNKIPVSHHLIATIASQQGISNTQFLIDKVHFTSEGMPAEYTLWEQVDSFLRSNPALQLSPMPDGELTLFDARSLHEATPVKAPGWRLFFRCSMWHKPNLGDGQLSLNEQLYTVFHPKVTDALQPRQYTPIECAPHYQVIDRVQKVLPIGELAKEPSLMDVDAEFLQKNGGPLAKSLLNKVPNSFFSDAEKRRLRVAFDFFVYRLYPSYQPNFPGYDKDWRLSGWHLPIGPDQVAQPPTPEIHASVSSCKDVVNQTEFFLPDHKTTISTETHSNRHYFWNNYDNAVKSKNIPGQVARIDDGDLVLTTSHIPRREIPTMNRGWRGMFRASMREKTSNSTGEVVGQQYVSIPYRGKGW